MRAVRLPLLVVALSALAASACGGAGTPSAPVASLTPYLRQLTAEATREGELDLVFATSDTTDEINAWTSGFNHYYGLSLRIVNTASPLMPQNATTLVQESGAHRSASTDVYFGVSIFIELLEHSGVAITGALHDLPNVAGITEDSDTTVRLAALPSGITYNTDRVKGAEIPRRLEDVLTEPNSVRIASSPYAGTLAGLPLVWGTDRAITYAVHLSAKLTGLFGCGEESRLVTGEFDMFVTDCGDNAARKLAARGAPIASTLPSDGSFLNAWYLVIPNNAAHPAAARLWINYLLSRQAQDILWQYELVDNPGVAGSHLAPLVASAQSRGTVFYPSDMATARRNEPLTPVSNCMQSILNDQPNDPSCTPYQSIMHAAAA